MIHQQVSVYSAKDGNALTIGPEGEAYVVVHPHPPKNEPNHPLPYRQYMTDDGSPAGSNDMRVNGSTTNVPFYVSPQSRDKDLYVGRLDVTIADAGAALNEFGSISALTNGVKFEWITEELGTVEIHEGLTSNWDFVRIAGGKPSFGSTTNAFRASNVSGNSEGYLISIDFDEIFNLRWGMKLRKGTQDKLVMTVRDNTSGVDQFDAIAYGIEF